MSDNLRVIGLMSGTSMDGIDAAILSTDGESVSREGLANSRPYGAELRARLKSGVDRAKSLSSRNDSDITDLEKALTEAHADAVEVLLAKADLTSADIDLIGFHGHTLDHRPHGGPDEAMTWQIGDGQLLADLTGIDVVCDFRSNDMAYGGQGAPLLPLYHAAMMRNQVNEDGTVALLNIGGVANLTWMKFSAEDELAMLAFDTGPGNALIDDWMQARTGQAYDDGGALAATGKADASVLATLMAHPYFTETPPKSLDRDAFSNAPCGALSDADGAATLTTFTAESIACGLEHCPETPDQIYVTGGGRHNATLMKMLNDVLSPGVHSIDDLGFDGDAVEAEGFAYLAARAARGLPITLPGTTGVDKPRSGGTKFTVGGA